MGIDPVKAEFIVGDFFTHELGDFDVTEDFTFYSLLFIFQVIYDHTFLCALPPSLRSNWASRLNQLTRKNGHLITLMFPIADHQGMDDN